MAADTLQSFKNMTTRQKVTVGVVVVVVLILLWQLYGLFFSGGSSTPPPVPGTPVNAMAGTPATSEGGATPMAIPTQAQLTPKPTEIPPAQVAATPESAREAELMRLQQQTQLQYIQAINELQMLRVNKDIADANKDISTSKLARVVAEKKILDLLSPPPPPPPSEITKTIVPAAALADQEIKYTVVSVTQLRSQWGAIMNYKGNLFSVHVDDILPPDGSKVLAIQKDGVTIEKDGTRQKLSLVPSI